MTTYKTYAQFNTVSFTGRVFNAELVNGKNGEFLAVTMITNLRDGDDGITVTFNNGNGLMSLFKKGYLPNGRILTVTGNMNDVSEVYDTKEGETKVRQRPQIHLVQAIAHVGPMPADKAPKASRKGKTVVRPSDANKVAEKTADELLDDLADETGITPEDTYAVM